MPTEDLRHERLGKPTALAVFASDNLSSSAYATEEILRVAVKGVGLAAFALVVPITIGLLAVLGILLFSYRQTIKAYPQAGGAYLVTRDNFGLLPAQIAGVSLLTDYILTVSVSVAAGTAALTSVFPGLFPIRVIVSVGFIALIALGNLRGVKESGRIFALPTYFFIGMMGLLLAVSFFRMATGQLVAVTDTFPIAPTRDLEGLVLIGLILHAAASGGAAVTGVEAISNGVPAFKPPEWENAITTLMWMGFLLGGMFLGLSIIAAKVRVVPDPSEQVTILAQVGKAAFGSGAGTVLLVMLQGATMLILVLAANTSFADFPRLASFHAGDHFLPRQLTRYGDRLVFSNGIISLAILSSILVIIFKASVTKLIPLYAIGVFTSFTFSQSGMSKRHFKLREAGWRRGMAINGLGALVTGLMTVIIAATKFRDGAWVVLVTTPLLLLALLRVNKHYHAAEQSLNDPARRPSKDVPRQRVIVAVKDGGENELNAIAYAYRVFPTDVCAVHFAPPGPVSSRILTSALGEAREARLGTGDLAADLRSYARDLHGRIDPGQIVNIIIPETVTMLEWKYVLHRHRIQHLKTALLSEPNVVVTNLAIRRGYEALEPGRHAASYSKSEAWRHIAILLVGEVNNASLGALRYARSIGAEELHCLHVEVDEQEGEKVEQAWKNEFPNLRLRLMKSPYRQITGPVKDYVRRLLEQEPRTFVTLVLPEVLVQKWWHRALHNTNALLLKGAFLFEPSVVVSAVPYRL